eukprot:TRINITY_DN6768_c0_g1_i1.p1 TRINITY_DN6768_c0_g1~~TRINITY_DN6768_c0_g1_i1.p1  ORF type:complete len:132 (-),score=0.77 TRINITY_DN6768_c0_g1_i1:98-493(-)
MSENDTMTNDHEQPRITNNTSTHPENSLASASAAAQRSTTLSPSTHASTNIYSGPANGRHCMAYMHRHLTPLWTFNRAMSPSILVSPLDCSVGSSTTSSITIKLPSGSRQLFFFSMSSAMNCWRPVYSLRD